LNTSINRRRRQGVEVRQPEFETMSEDTRNAPESATPVSKREFLKGAGATAAVAGLGAPALAAAEDRFDLIIVGGGNAGLPAAIFAAGRGARVLVVEAAGQVGGTLFLSSGQMSAGGTKLQKSKGIEDSAQLHYEDVMRISSNTADPVLMKLAVFNAAPVFDWLMDNGFDVHENHPVTGTTHEPYSRPRYAWGKNGGRSILKVLNAQLKPHVDAGRVKLLLQTEVTGLVQRRDGTVEGVTTKNVNGETGRYLARNTVLTSGGYTANVPMYEKYEGHRDYSKATYPYSQGIGITLGLAAGGYVRGGEKYTPLFGAVLANDDFPSPINALVRHFPGDRPPWEIFVNEAGQRFLQEDVPSHNVYEASIREQKDQRCWVVFDDEIFRKAPKLVMGGINGPWTEQDTKDAFESGDVAHFHRAGTLAELAKKAGFDAANFEKTVADYNRAQASGKDTLGRKYMPLPIAKAPFYAIQLDVWNLTTYGGIAVDGRLRVIRRDGRPIPGLYAAGELLGMGTMMGRSVVGGMSVTPALALGRLLGNEILSFG
jgi:fumarate reductase flavoprotein subunit